MHPVFADLDRLVSESTTFSWINTDGHQRLVQHRELKCAELRMKHIALLVFATLSAVLAFTFCATGIIVPLANGHVLSGVVKLIVGMGLGFLAYEVNLMRDIVQRAHAIFDQYLRMKENNTLTSDVKRVWKFECESLKEQYKKLYVVDTVMDAFWPTNHLIFSFVLFFMGFFSPIQAVNLEEMVGEMLLVHFHGDMANEESAKLLTGAHVGGFIFYNWANNLTNKEQVSNLTQSLEQQAKKPLFFAVDQEGGRIIRLKEGFSQPPANGSLISEAEAYAWAKKSGDELRAVGINVNLAPVVDVNSNPDNPVIGNRSYSSDPHIVATMGAAALQGFEDAGIIAVLKHFPGHGDTRTDSHLELPLINKSREELELNELVPFRALASKAKAIMTGHLLIPELDRTSPVTTSSIIVESLLINDINFKGLIITDSLAMQGIINTGTTIEEIAIQAVEAGHDILLLGGRQLQGDDEGFELKRDDIIHVHNSVCNAVKEGRISEERIEASWRKIRSIKNLF